MADRLPGGGGRWNPVVLQGGVSRPLRRRAHLDQGPPNQPRGPMRDPEEDLAGAPGPGGLAALWLLTVFLPPVGVAVAWAWRPALGARLRWMLSAAGAVTGLLLLVLFTTTASGSDPSPAAATSGPARSAAVPSAQAGLPVAAPGAAVSAAPAIVPAFAPPTRITVVSPHVSPGDLATVVAVTSHGAACTIRVDYRTGPATAPGLGPSIALPDGTVSWTWRVAARVTPGTFPVTVDCGSAGRATGTLQVG